MKLPIGYDNFGAVIEQKLDFVDKSLFIKEILDDNATQVAVITRPRRFGKTLNLSMLHYFLASEIDGRSTQGLFDHLKIAKENNGHYLKQQGQHPVIFVSFKEVKNTDFEGAASALQSVIAELYRGHRYLLQSQNLAEDEKALFQRILEGAKKTGETERSLKTLSELLYKHTGKKVFILIDEYDTPIQASYLNKYYPEMINLMRNMFGAALKTNPFLDRAVVTGILRVSKESIFSDLNNIKVYSLLASQYSNHFGFTEEEVADLLVRANLAEKASEIKSWYNGYRFGNTVIYNPWSIANCINEKGAMQSYWVNTSENTLIKNLLIQSRADFKILFESLLQGQPIEAKIDENMVFGDLEKNTLAALSLMLLSGYLKAVSAYRNDDGETVYRLDIPNVEVKNLYRQIVKQWLANGHGLLWYNDFLEHLLSGNIPELERNLSDILLQTVSVYDTARNNESFYHGLMLGLAASLDKTKYELKSNRESGLGRYDIAILPKDILKPAIILELKSVTPPKSSKSKLSEVSEKQLTKEAKLALKQIDQKHYIAEMTQRGFKKIVKIGLAFAGKEFKIASAAANSRHTGMTDY